MLKNYVENLNHVTSLIDQKILNNVIDLISKTIKKAGTIFVCGNGGSASISSHILCDWTKRLYPSTKCKVYDLTNNKSLISAISNDISYDDIFSYQLNIHAVKKDICIFISSSGNSKNIINGLVWAKKNKIKTISITGFDGGFAKKNSDISIFIETNKYEYHEDLTQIIMHYFYQRLRNIKNN